MTSLTGYPEMQVKIIWNIIFSQLKVIINIGESEIKFLSTIVEGKVSTNVNSTLEIHF